VPQLNPELFMFVDERMTRTRDAIQLTVGCVVVDQNRWRALHSDTRHVARVGGKKQLDMIKSLLDKVGGLAFLSYANPPMHVIPSGELDGTSDIPSMMRTDNAWSMAVLLVAVSVLASLRVIGLRAATIDLFYDPKSLTAAHRVAFERALRETLPDIAREDPITQAVDAAPNLRFRRVENVPKAQRDALWSPLQNGTYVVDRLCTQASKLAPDNSSARIVVSDRTDVLCDMIRKFE
jgi:hypothetical protein